MRTSETDLVAKFLVVMTACMVLLVSMFAYMVFTTPGVVPPPIAAQEHVDAPGANTPSATKCDLSRIGGMDCDDDSLCVRGRCQPLADEDRIAQEGESCRDLDCAPDLVCHELRCRKRGDVTFAPLDCRDPEVAGAVSKLKTDCGGRETSFEELKSLSACNGDAWRKISLKDKEFDLLLSKFKHRFSVHFDVGEPREGKRGEVEHARTHYVTQLRRLREPLANARQIFVIGRSSPDGDEDENYRLALRRIDMVASMLEQVVNGDVPRIDQKPLPIQQWGLSGDRLILPEFFAKHYLSPTIETEFGLSPMIAHDAATEDDLTDLLARSGSGQLSVAENRRLVGALNRVVIVVPIPCDGSEYVPSQPVVPVRTREAL